MAFSTDAYNEASNTNEYLHAAQINLQLNYISHSLSPFCILKSPDNSGIHAAFWRNFMQFFFEFRYWHNDRHGATGIESPNKILHMVWILWLQWLDWPWLLTKFGLWPKSHLFRYKLRISMNFLMKKNCTLSKQDFLQIEQTEVLHFHHWSIECSTFNEINRFKKRKKIFPKNVQSFSFLALLKKNAFKFC